MKKLLFLILSSVFILFIPNVANAETTGLEFYEYGGVFFDSNSTTRNVLFHYPWGANYGEGNLVFSIQSQDAGSPFSAMLNMNNNIHYSCYATSIPIQDTSPGNTNIITFTCPFNWTQNSFPYSITFERSFTGSQGYFYLPRYVSFTTKSQVDVSSITTSQNNTTNAVNNVNDSINNDSVSTNTENSSTASSWASNNASDSVVSDMVLMPITLLNAFSNGFNGSCQSYNLGSLYGTDLTLPCINIQNYLGATLWGIIDVLMSGFLIYGIGKKFVRVFNDFTNLKDSQVDELYGGGNE